MKAVNVLETVLKTTPPLCYVHYYNNTEGSLIPFTAVIMLKLKLRDQSLFNHTIVLMRKLVKALYHY